MVKEMRVVTVEFDNLSAESYNEAECHHWVTGMCTIVKEEPMRIHSKPIAAPQVGNGTVHVHLTRVLGDLVLGTLLEIRRFV